MSGVILLLPEYGMGGGQIYLLHVRKGCATSRTVAGSIADGVFANFH